MLVATLLCLLTLVGMIVLLNIAFELPIMGELSAMQLAKLGVAAGGILFQFRANKQYIITLNRDYTQEDLHLYIYAEDIKFGTDYRYEVAIGKYGGMLVKREVSET